MRSQAWKGVEISPQANQSPVQAHAPVGQSVAAALCGLLGISGLVIGLVAPSAGSSWRIAAYVGAWIAGGIVPMGQAISSLRKGQLSVDLLMILAASGAAAIGDWGEAVVLLFLFSLSGALEAFAMYRTHRSIESLVQLRPREALRVRQDCPEGELVAVDSLAVGDTIRIRPGERYAVDGVIREGETWADESTLTGESRPIHKREGEMVYSGTINGQGNVVVQMTRAVADTTLERIVHMVQEAQSQKTPTQRFVESWQQPYVLGVLIAATLVFLGARVIHTQQWYDAFYHAMVLLVAASPCAVVVSAPAVLLSAIARAGLDGILFKGGIHLESLGRVETIAFDKTGTITRGKPGIAEVWIPPECDESQLLALAACVEHRSEHPLAQPVVAEIQKRGIAPINASILEFHSHVGQGVHARVDGVWVGVGREGLFESHDITIPSAVREQAHRMREQGLTALIVITDSRQAGVIGVADQIRPEARATIATLKTLGIQKVVILSGDHQRIAETVAASVNADEVRAGLLPDQKVGELRRLAEHGQFVAMVGDGVNDAPALAAAQVGIAMGGAGTDVALEVADVVLMQDSLSALPQAVRLSKLARKRVRQNVTFAFSMIGLLVISTFFDLPLWLGVLGHEGSTLIVVFNGVRILWDRAPQLAG